MPSGYYVTARTSMGGTNTGRTAWLCGPFQSQTAAMWMVRPVERATRKLSDPRFAFAWFGATKLTVPKGKTLPPGRLDYALIDAWDLIER